MSDRAQRNLEVPMSVTDELLKNNEKYAEGFEKADLAMPPAKKVAVVACMDARLIPTRALGLNEGEAHVLRNAGGVITDEEIRSLAISQHLLGTEEIILIHHTDCGMLTFTDEELAQRLEEETGSRPPWSGHAFDDIEGNLRESIRTLKESPFIPHKQSIRGFVYEVESGRLREVT
jgi:carbonic anhydrase